MASGPLVGRDVEALAGLALAGAGVIAIRAARRPHVAHAA